MQINRKQLLNALKLVGRAVPIRPMIPVLDGILFHVEGTSLTLTGFDINNGIRVELPIDEQSHGYSFLLNSKVIQAVLSKFNTSEIDIETQDSSVILSNETASVEIRMIAGANDYPVEAFALGEVIPQPIDRLAIEAMLSVLFATSDDESKQTLQSVNIAATGGELTFAATDGHRLAITKIDSDTQIGSINLGNSGLKLLSGFNFTDEEITIARTDSGLIITQSATTFLIREIEGKYPNYTLLLPANSGISTTICKREFIDAIELSRASDTVGTVIKLDIAAELLTISSESPIVKSSSTIESKLIGDPVALAMNSGYLLDALNQISTEEITLNIDTPLSPIVIKWQQQQLQRTVLLMPIQLRS